MDTMFVVLVGVWMVVVIGLPLYLQNRRSRKMLQTLNQGDEVLLLNGVLGKVIRTDGDVIEVEIGPKVRVRCLPSALSVRKSRSR